MERIDGSFKGKITDGFNIGEIVEVIPPRYTWDSLAAALKAVEQGERTAEAMLHEMWDDAAHKQELYGVADDGTTIEKWRSQ